MSNFKIQIDSAAPYFALGAVDQTTYHAWCDHRFAIASSSNAGTQLVIQNSDGRVLLRRQDTDSKALHTEIWEVNLIDAEPDRVQYLLRALAENFHNSNTLLTMLIPFEASATLEAAQLLGAMIRGANVAWGFNRNQLLEADLYTELRSLKLSEPYQQSFLECVQSSYSAYRSHYHADTKLATVASDVYVQQVLDAVADGIQVIVTVDDEDRVTAFTTIEPHGAINDFTGRSLVSGGGISGVSLNVQRKGLYAANIRATLQAMIPQGYEHYTFGTAANNFAIQRTWIRMGLYRPRRFTYRLHWRP